MRGRMAASSAGLGVVLLIGCSATSRHKTLSLFFDGVPDPNAVEATQGRQTTPTTIGAPSQAAPGSQHGPYAAKLCNGCHSAAATNALVAPSDELCFRCHDLALDSAYVHGPLASGGCLVCHDPHSSRYRHLLVSEAGTFCIGCHDRDTVAKIEGHGDLTEGCTTCHDAHGSDTKYLLK